MLKKYFQIKSLVILSIFLLFVSGIASADLAEDIKNEADKKEDKQ